MKRYLIRFVLLCCCLFALTGTASAYVQKTDILCQIPGGSVYFDKETGTITGCIANTIGASLTIPREIEGVTVRAIGTQAFFNCRALKSVALPHTLVTIGESAFFRTSLQDVTIPDSVVTLEKEAFLQCLSLKSVKLSKNLKTIGDSAFDYCRSLTSIELPDGLTTIGNNAFDACSLTGVSIPDSVTSLGENSFYGCPLTSLKLPEGITEIPRCAFAGCQLERLEIPASVRRINGKAFEGSAITFLTLPEGLEEIDYFAFWGCKRLLQVVIPGSVRRIGDQAFSVCRSLSGIFISSGVEEIGREAFSATNYTVLTIPKSVTTLGFAPFVSHLYRKADIYYEGTKAELRAIMPDGLESVAYYADSEEYGYHPENAVLHCGEPMPTPPDLEKQTTPFADVPENSYFHLPVFWAATAGITGGTSAATFSPYSTCTLAQVITFLWRANGCYLEEGKPFTNVPANSYYADAAVWAYEYGMIEGGTFEANKPCTREMLVTLLWKKNRSPDWEVINGNYDVYHTEVAEDNRMYYAKVHPFTDVPREGDTASAIGWAYSRGITNGTTDTLFSPDRVCTRAQVMAILYRASGKDLA